MAPNVMVMSMLCMVAALVCTCISTQNRIAGQFGLGSDDAREPYREAARRWSRAALFIAACGAGVLLALVFYCLAGGVK